VVLPRQPRGLLFKWTHPNEGGRDLIVFLSEAQPSQGNWNYANALVEVAKRMGVERIVAFASMATGMHPGAAARVFGVATNESILEELKRLEVEALEDGQIGGMNGVVLAAAASHGLEGVSLLGEIPAFAAHVPNPKAARAVLSVFCVLAGIDLSLATLDRDADTLERALLRAMEKMQRQQMGEFVEEGEEEGDDDEDSEEAKASSGPTAAKPKTGPVLDADAKARIEQLFEDAKKDRSKAGAVRKELDRLGVFASYEDRFLDLFKRAE
jgi:predicted ATP-grasp superfamily ATP-dependent carboligase